MGNVFLSYSRKDAAFVEKLHGRLMKDGVECFFDKKSIAWGDNWVLALEKGIKNCEFIVLVLSPAFLESEWAKLERTSVMAADPAGQNKQLLPLLLSPCGERIPPFLQPIQMLDVTTPELFEKNYELICHKLGGTVIKTIGTTDRTKPPPVADLPHRHWMPYRSLGNGFVGRGRDLWDIHDILRERKTAVVEGVGIVVGTGGLGKTQLAIEYVHRFGVSYPGGVFWIDAEQGMERMIIQLTHGSGVEIDDTLDEKDQLVQLWRQLACFQTTLVVLDNFPEHKPLQPYLPSAASIHILVTTRRRDLGKYSRIPLGFMNGEEGIKLLNTGERQFGQEAEVLVEALGGLPLALELTQNFLNARPSLAIDELLVKMKGIGDMESLALFTTKYADEMPSGHIREVAATFRMSWDLAPAPAQRVLQCMALLAPTPVPRRLLRKILELPLENLIEDPLEDSLENLARKLSLLELDETGDPWIHRLIAGFVRSSPIDDDLKKRVAAAVRDEMARVTDEKDVQSYRELEKVVPHAEMLLRSDFFETEQAIDISDCIGWHYGNWGKYRLAETYRRQALNIAEKKHEPGHPTIAVCQSNLAIVLQDLGEYGEAAELLRKALAADEASFEPGHPNIAVRQSNLAMVLKDLGEYGEAAELLRKALAADEASFEPGHPNIAVRQSNLAMVLKDLGEYGEAAELLRKAYKTLLEKFGPDRPNTNIIKSNWEIISKRAELLRKALAADEASFEPGHPNIAVRQSNLAMVLKDLGAYDEAAELLRKALAADEVSFEPGHPTIAGSQSNLAIVLKALGEYGEAAELLRKALAADEASFEPGHPTIAGSQSNLAMVLKDLGAYDEAEELLRKAHQTFLEKFGPAHPKTKIVKSNWEIVSKQAASSTD